MAKIAKKHTDELEPIKDNIRNSHTYFKSNYDSFHEHRSLLYRTTLNNDTLGVLSDTQKPQIEFNICEAYVSRLVGEFSKHEPSLETHASAGHDVDPQLIEVVDGHLRAIFENTRDEGQQEESYTDALSGGFSALKVEVDYPNPMSFEMEIYVKKLDPTLVGFDPLARKVHKGDGRYIYNLIPKRLEEAEEEFNMTFKNVTFSKEMGGFSWYYQSGSDSIILFADYYEKKSKRKRIVKLSDGQVMTASDYEKFLEKWQRNGILKPPPIIIDAKSANVDIIWHYIITGNEIISAEETPHRGLPIVFVDGNSQLLTEGVTGATRLVTRPYVYNIQGVQKLKNFAGQCLANELENMIQHKIMVAKEAIPEGYLEPYQNFQKANCLVYNAFFNDNPQQPLPPPREIVRTPIPPEITNTFRLADETAQMILGNFDADLARLSQNEVSGIAIQEAVTLSNAAAMPYLVNYMKCLTQCGWLILGLIPKFYVTPRTIPVHTKEGQRHFVEINGEGQIKLDYDADSLNINIKAGVNFSVQKTRALQQLIFLMQASPLFQEFMNQEGLPILLDNIDMRGIESLKEVSEEYMQKVKQARESQDGQQQAAQQQAMQQQQQMVQALQLEMERLKLEKESLSQKVEEFTANLHLKIAEMQSKQNQFDSEMQIEQQKVINERLKMSGDLEISKRNMQVQEDKASAEIYRGNVELAGKIADRSLQHLENSRGQDEA